ICKAKTIISVLQIRMSKRKAIISKRIVFIDGLYMIIAGPDPIISGVDSIIDIHEAMMSIVETTISTTQTNFPRGDTVISAFPTSFLAAEIIILSFKKTAWVVSQLWWKSGKRVIIQHLEENPTSRLAGRRWRMTRWTTITRSVN